MANSPSSSARFIRFFCLFALPRVRTMRVCSDLNARHFVSKAERIKANGNERSKVGIGNWKNCNEKGLTNDKLARLEPKVSPKGAGDVFARGIKTKRPILACNGRDVTSKQKCRNRKVKKRKCCPMAKTWCLSPTTITTTATTC